MLIVWITEGTENTENTEGCLVYQDGFHKISVWGGIGLAKMCKIW